MSKKICKGDFVSALELGKMSDETLTAAVNANIICRARLRKLWPEYSEEALVAFQCYRQCKPPAIAISLLRYRLLEENEAEARRLHESRPYTPRERTLESLKNSKEATQKIPKKAPPKTTKKRVKKKIVLSEKRVEDIIALVRGNFK